MNRRHFLSLVSAGTLLPQPVLSATSGFGIIFVGASWCPVCKQAAPVLALYAQQSGLPVLVASKDGRPIAPFPEFVESSQHPIAMHYSALPTTLVFSRAAGRPVYAFEGYRDPRWYLLKLARGLRAAQELAHG